MKFWILISARSIVLGAAVREFVPAGPKTFGATGLLIGAFLLSDWAWHG